MRGSSFARVILAMALFSINLTNAGWFDSAEKEEPARNRRGRRGVDSDQRPPEGPDYDPSYQQYG